MKKIAALLSFALVRGLLVAPAMAQNDEIGKINRAAKNQSDQKVLDLFSTELSVPAGTLKQQKQQYSLSYGQLFVANSIADASGKTVNAIVSQFWSGKGWGQIARDNNVSLGDVVSNARHAEEDLRKNLAAAIDNDERIKIAAKEAREDLKLQQKREHAQLKAQEKADHDALKSSRKN